MIQTIVKKNTSFITKELNIDDNIQIDKIKYGLELLLSEMFKLSILLIEAIFINKVAEFILITLLLCSIRTAIGGSHSKSFNGCMIKSICIYNFLYLLSASIKEIPLMISILSILFIIIVLSQVTYKNKINTKINSKEKNIKLRVKLVLISISSILITMFFIKDICNLTIYTQLIIIIDYLIGGMKNEKGNV